MTNKEILKQALLKVQKTGHDYKNHLIEGFLNGNEIFYSHTIGDYDGQISYEEIIFSHDFAKAFWGEQKQKKRLSHFYENTGLNFAITWEPHAFFNEFGKDKYEECLKNDFVWVNETKCPSSPVKPSYSIFKIEKSGWQYYLQQMVLEKEPLKYLEKFLKD